MLWPGGVRVVTLSLGGSKSRSCNQLRQTLLDSKMQHDNSSINFCPCSHLALMLIGGPWQSSVSRAFSHAFALDISRLIHIQGDPSGW